MGGARSAAWHNRSRAVRACRRDVRAAKHELEGLDLACSLWRGGRSSACSSSVCAQVLSIFAQHGMPDCASAEGARPRRFQTAARRRPAPVGRSRAGKQFIDESAIPGRRPPAAAPRTRQRAPSEPTTPGGARAPAAGDAGGVGGVGFRCGRWATCGECCEAKLLPRLHAKFAREVSSWLTTRLWRQPCLPTRSSRSRAR